ncbi:MAG: restriction endonuclease subunit S [Candidatus Rokubacteria bacterium]|nr:restriction endonuclease subunit S [Candidatus Rokubacteria bacterium]
MTDLPRRPSVQKRDYKNEGPYPVVDQGASVVAGYTDRQALVHGEVPVIVFGDHTRALKYIDFPFASGGEGVKIFRARPDVAETRYLYYALRSVAIPSRGYNRHFAVLGGRSLLIPVDLQEQRAIARVLAMLEKTVMNRAAVATALRGLKDRTLRTMLGDGLRGARTRTTMFGRVPDNWRTEALADIAEVQTGIAKGRRYAHDDTVELPYLRVANVQDGRLDLRDVKSMVVACAEIEKYRLRRGDVVLTEGGDFDKLGRGFIWDGQIDPCVHQNHVFAVRTRRSVVLPEFFAYLAQSPYGKAYFRHVAHKTTNLACINASKLKAFPVLVPEVEEQEDIVTILRALDRLVELAERRHAVLRSLFDTIQRQLTSGERRLSAGLIAKLSSGADAGSRDESVRTNETAVVGAVERMVHAVAPERIILFGSAARGEMTADSDLDFLVVKAGMDRDEAYRRIRDEIYRDRRGVGRAVDVIVVTPDEVERYRDVVGHVIQPALAEGRVVYAA